MNEHSQMQLLELLAAGKGPANMWEAGEQLGWDRHTTEDMATDLMAKGLVAIASLSGGVRVTEEGLSHLSRFGGSGSGEPAPDGLTGWLAELKAAGDMGLSSGAGADLRVDIETMEAQLKRGRPLKDVLSALLSAMQSALATSEQQKAKELMARGESLAASL